MTLRQALTQRVDAAPLAAWRIALGLCVILVLAGPVIGGAADAVWLAPEHGGYRPGGRLPWLVGLLGGRTPAVIHGLIGVGMLAGAATAAGLGGRVSIFVALQAFQAVTDANSHSGGGFDTLLQNGLWLLVLAPSTATWSLDSKLTTGRWDSGRTVPAWWLWLPRFQLIVLVYWTTGLQKISHHWIPGGDLGALYYVLQQPSWQRFDMSWLAPFFPLTQLATLTTWVWEVTMPLWFAALLGREGWSRGARLARWRLPEIYAVIGAGMHLTIVLLMEVGPFSLVTFAWYAAFWTGADYRAVLRRLRIIGPGSRRRG